jgi:hypothetical protein
LVLTFAVGSARAQRLEISNLGIRATFPALRFAAQAEGPEFVCPVTLEGTFHSRTIAKTPEALIGYITRSVVKREGCALGPGVEDVVLEHLPWHIRYAGFVGTLPIFTRKLLRIIDMLIRLRALGVTCLFRSTTANPLRGWFERNITTGGIVNLQLTSESSVPLFEGPFVCPSSLGVEGTGNVRLLGSSTTSIFMRLI